jgi:hypothetical protein
MGASNFSRCNASKIFTMFFPREEAVLDEDGNETGETEYVHPEDYQVEDELDSLRYNLEELPFSSYGSDRKNRGETFVASLSSSKSYGDIEATVEVYCSLEHGYHEGAMLDWDVYLDFGNANFDDDQIDLDNIRSEYSDSSDLSVGLQVILSKKALAWINKTRLEMIEEVEKIFEMHSDLKLAVVASFSNGETWYEKI